MSTFVGTGTGIDADTVNRPSLGWRIILRIDEVVSGTLPAKDIRFPVHSPYQEGIQVGQRYKVSVKKRKTGNTYEVLSYGRLD